MASAGALVVAGPLAGCARGDRISTCAVRYGENIPVAFKHGVASGDPTANSVILWTRVSPVRQGTIVVSWRVATDRAFSTLTHEGASLVTADTDYTLKLDAVGLQPGKRYYYQFRANGAASPTGVTRTLPVGRVNSLKMAVMSCSNYGFGYFHSYDAVSKREDIDLVLHLGDYIYEYPSNVYPRTAQTLEGREPEPDRELVSLSDYRTRYAQYRSDSDLQAVHAQKPFICVWDDHEIANNTWRAGAQNHDEELGEGKFSDRVAAALQAYFEWLPIRGKDPEETVKEINRSFRFGDLLTLHMLDTRYVGRDEQLSYGNYVDADSGQFSHQKFLTELENPARTILGSEQLDWLNRSIQQNTTQWQVLGQQVVMSQHYLPAALMLRRLDYQNFGRLARLAQLGQQIRQGTRVSSADRELYRSGASELTPELLRLLQLPDLPMRLDSWDGYPADREKVYRMMAQSISSFVVLAGDTHNAWASNLVSDAGDKVGLEFATHSVTSPGLEGFLGNDPKQLMAAEQDLVSRMETLEYLNARDRGFMVVTFLPDKVRSEWFFVSDIRQPDYEFQTDRYHAVEADRDELVMRHS